MLDLKTYSKIDDVVCKIVGKSIETDSESCFLNQPTYNKPNSKTVMKENISIENNNDAEIHTARYYEVCEGVIHESFSTLEDLGASTEILEEAETELKDDLIVVISDDINQEELVNLYDRLKERLKFIVHYGNNQTVKRIFEHFSQIISVDSLTKAVNKSHLLAQNGQTIFFPKVSANFDFFGHVDFA